MALLGELADVEVASPEAQGHVDRALLVVEAGARQVEVQGVGAGRLGGGDEAEPDLGVVARQESAIAFRHRFPAQEVPPELREPGGVLGVVRSRPRDVKTFQAR